MKKIVGIKIRVDNKKVGEIGKLWQKFFSESHIEKLGLQGKPTYGVYYNYSSGRNGDFDLLIGGETDNIEGYDIIEIADTPYKEYSTNGTMPSKIHTAWAEIWNDHGIQRAYKTDYEYYTSSGDVKNPNVCIFVGLK